MSTLKNFNINPYFDDFDDSKKFLKLLFKPGFAIQARELTQIQSLLQDQISKFGDHVFKNGSLVSGGQTTIQNAVYLTIDPEYNGELLSVSDFEGKTIVDNLTNANSKAEVLKTYESIYITSEPKTLIIKSIYENVNSYANSSTIITVEDNPRRANITSNGICKIFSVDEGVYYYEGYFIKTDPQTIALSKYSTTPNVRVGFQIEETIVTDASDTSLLDPALNASNYQAPGSDRYKIDLILSTRPFDSTDSTKFIEIAQVVQGKLLTLVDTPQYSVLEDTLARRTYDESGNYTVRPFAITLETNSSNTAQTNVILSPGKAYIYGYEFQTISPTVITVPKPRTTQNVNNRRITADYGNFIYTKDRFGSLPLNTMTTIDLHCVVNASINRTTTNSIANTKIGTVRVKSDIYDSSVGGTTPSFYRYKTYIFDVNVGSLTANLSGSTPSSFTQLTLPSGFSTTSNAYQGAKIRITEGPGSGQPARTITAYDGSTKNVTISTGFTGVVNTQSKFSIDFEFNDAKSLVINSGTTALFSTDRDTRSIDRSTPYSDTIISETDSEALIFPLGENYIANNTITDLVYSFKKLYQSVSFDSSGISPGLSVDVNETLASASSDLLKLKNYQIVVTSVGSSVFAVGQTVPTTAFSVDTGLRQITVTGGTSMTANVIATIDVSPTVPSKLKEFVSGNTQLQTSGGADIFANGNALLWASAGQVQIGNTSTSFVVKVPNVPQSLYVSDVISIKKILDFSNTKITPANFSSAIDVTNKYTLDSGQRNSFYDHASIKLKPGVQAPKGPLLVVFDRFKSSGTSNYLFSLQSYVQYPYDNIPKYTDSKGNVYNLRDCLDFRPVRKDADAVIGNSFTFDVDPTKGPKIPENSSDILLDYSYHLPRIDKVVLNKNRSFEVLLGEPSTRPLVPNDKDNSMNLYILNNPAYVANTSEIGIKYIENKRYTMRDIGTIEKRVENLEYYTSLSLLEQETLSKQDLTILDSQNVPRFKNGIVVDSFVGHGVADVSKLDYSAAIDPNKKELRPSFDINSYSMSFRDDYSSGYGRSGSLVYMDSEPVLFVNQQKATRVYNVNQFLLVDYIGKIELTPKSDVWVDTTVQPDLLVNIEGNKDAWDLISQRGFSTEWGNWSTYWTGVDVNRNVVDTSLFTTTTTTTTTTNRQSRTGVESYIVPETITRSLGDKIVDLSIVPYMRTIDITFVGSNFKPNSKVYPFFDLQLVESNVRRANKVFLSSNNLSYKIEVGNFELVQFINNSSQTINATARIIKTSNNEAFVIDTIASSNLNFTSANLRGETTTAYNKIIGYEHYSGLATNFSTNTLQLALDAGFARNQNTYNSLPIYIVAGQGAGQTRTISSYNPSTRTVTVSSNWDTVPAANSVYSIGVLETNLSGDLAGVFTVPKGTFRTGEKTFRLIDDRTNNIGASFTNGDVNFYSQGSLKTVQETIISATVPSIARRSVSDETVVTTTTSSTSTVIKPAPPPPPPVIVVVPSPVPVPVPNPIPVPVPSPPPPPPPPVFVPVPVPNPVPVFVPNPIPVPVPPPPPEPVWGWWDNFSNIGDGGGDPLSQTFFIDPKIYPQGIFLDKARFCFRTKDETQPIILEVRPVVNGYPSASVIYPNGIVSLTPDKVKLVTDDVPNLDDPQKYTDFVFNAPVYLQPGEHCFVMICNSLKYEVYAAELGQIDLASKTAVSEQPTLGSFFLSQNSRTWTPEQNVDMMFRLYRKKFVKGTPSVLKFTVTNPPTSNHSYDVANLIVGDMALPNTSIQYSFDSISKDTLSFTGYKNINNSEDYDMNDGDGSRLMTTSNNSFVLNAVLQTFDESITPMIDLSRIGLLTISNRINELPLVNSGFIVSNTGSNYTTSGSVTVTLSGGGGSGAAAYANVVDGGIDAIYLSSNGSGYTSSPTVTITDAGSGVGAVVTYNGEDRRSGGNAEVRYMTRKITLADGFDSGDLRVYLTAYKPNGSQIYVYYKLLSVSDPDEFDDKNYQLMTQLGNQSFISLNKDDYREIIFAPGINGEANNSIIYASGDTSFRNFKTFAIKVVMSGSNTTDVPKVRDFRAIALPSGE